MSAIDYDLSKIRAFAFDVDGVLSPSCVPLGDNGLPRRMVNVKDGFAIVHACRRGFRIAIITGATSDAIDARYRALGVEHIYQGAAHKLPVLTKWAEDLGLSAEEILFMGDDIPDLGCITHAGVGCAPSDAAPEVLAAARYISDRAGGQGCARDVIAQVMKAQGKWMDNAEAFGW